MHSLQSNNDDFGQNFKLRANRYFKLAKEAYGKNEIGVLLMARDWLLDLPSDHTTDFRYWFKSLNLESKNTFKNNNNKTRSLKENNEEFLLKLYRKEWLKCSIAR